MGVKIHGLKQQVVWSDRRGIELKLVTLFDYSKRV
jgi:hypothetical protein